MISLQRQIYDFLVGLIERGELSPGGKTPAESELCERFQASRNTVRKAYDELVHKGLVARKPGLGSFVLPQKVSSKLSFGIIVPSLEVFSPRQDPFAGQLKLDLFNGMLRRAGETGTTHQLVPAEDRWRPAGEGFDGYLVMYPTREILEKLRAASVPHMESSIGERLGKVGVGIDFDHCFQDCLEYLIALGHRKIGFIGNGDPTDKAPAAYAAKLKRYGLPYDAANTDCFLTGASSEGGAALARLLTRSPGLDAVFFRTDFAALSGLEYCASIGLKVPEDISIMGFDNIPAARTAVPPLTSYDTAREECGYLAVKKLEERIANPAIPESFETIRGKVVERDSARRRA